MARMTLREAREKLGKSGDDIAADLGIARSTLYRLESGENQPNEELARQVHDYYASAGIKLEPLAVIAPKWFDDLVAA